MNTIYTTFRLASTQHLLRQVHTQFRNVPSTRHRYQHTQATNMEWLAIIPDHDNALAKRMEVRPSHLDQLPPDIAAGQIVFGGAMLSAQPKDGEAPAMAGSVMLFKDMTEEEVRERIRSDPYAQRGVWDVEKVRIMPFKTAFRIAT